MSLTERQMERYCDVLIWALKTARKGGFEKNDVILLRYDLAAIRMAEILQGKVLAMGMNAIP
ncbi:MAG: aminopeptidase, partial [Desulfobacterales bacterium]|nr:aminopeptidase [Desulfobacterales bacterium]